MRLLSVIPVMGVGGAETVAAALSTDARSRGHDVLLASAGGFRADALAADGVPHLPIPLGSRRPVDLVRSAATLRSACRARRPAVVHAHNVKAALVARLALGRAVPVLVTVHGVPDADLSTAVRVLRGVADHVVAVSPHVAGQLAAHGLPRSRVSVVENAVGSLPERPRDRARDRLGIPAGMPVALCLARMVDQKRHDLLVEAWARTRPAGLLLLAGDGPNRGSVEAAVRRHGLQDRVRLLGERTDVDWLLAAADVAVLPTDWEGLPISLLEAMGAGVPVVVTRVGGVVETLGDGVRLVPPGSVDELARALSSVLGDPAARAALGRRGRDLVAARYGPGRMLDAYADLYDRLDRSPALGRVA